MPGVINQGALNPSSLTAPGVYVQILPPPTFITGVPTNVYGAAGSASWGPVGVPVLLGSPAQGTTAYGPIVGSPAPSGAIAAINNPYDLATDIFCAFQQSTSSAGLQVWGLRVVDGTMYAQGGSPGAGGGSANTTGAYASLALLDADGDTGLTAYGFYMGSLGNGITISIAQGSKGAGYFTVNVAPPAGVGLLPEVYPNVVGTVGTSASFTWTDATDTDSVQFLAGTGFQGAKGNNLKVVVATGVALANSIATVGAITTVTLTINTGTTTPALLKTYVNTTAAAALANYISIGTTSGTTAFSVFLASTALAGGVGSTFWSNFSAALQNGIQGTCPPSKLIVGILATALPDAPAVLTATALSGGIDGNSVVSYMPTAILGSSSATPQTGLFALRGLNPPVAVFSLCGFGEASGDFSNLATVQTFADSEGAVFVSSFPTGDSTSAAIALVGTDDFEVVYVQNRAFFNDGVNGPRFHSMAPFLAGLIATLPPWVSPLNQQVKGIIGTERTIVSATQAAAGVLPIAAPYSLAEIGQLQAGRISLVTSPSPGGNYLGVCAAVNSSSNPASSPIEYSTMTNFLAKSFSSSLGKYIGQNQTTSPTDRVRQMIRNDFNNFLQGLVNNNAINSFSVTCNINDGLNTAATIAAHYLYAQVLVKYLASIWYFLTSFTGGTTVNVTVNSGN